MARAREKTPQIGFWDAEVSEVNHDQIQIWVHNNIERVLRVAIPDGFDRGWKEEDSSYSCEPGRGISMEELREARHRAINEIPRPDPKAGQIDLEHALIRCHGYADRSQQIVGYADLLVLIEFPVLTAFGDEPFKASFERRGSVRIFVCEAL